jgi:inorganic pyrophosphatase
MTEPQTFVCVVEIPKGGRNKYEFDHELGGIKFDRLLMSAATYPTDYGYLRNTLAEDGDELDVLVLLTEPTFPGCLIEVKPIAVLEMADEEGVDNKVLCVPCQDPNWMDLEQLDDIPAQLRTEIEHFFSIYKEPEGKPVDVKGWRSRETALEVLAESRARYQSR